MPKSATSEHPLTVPIQTRLAPTELRAVELIAAREERTMSQVLRRLVRSSLQSQGLLDPPASTGELLREDRAG